MFIFDILFNILKEGNFISGAKLLCKEWINSVLIIQKGAFQFIFIVLTKNRLFHLYVGLLTNTIVYAYIYGYYV